MGIGVPLKAQGWGALDQAPQMHVLGKAIRKAQGEAQA